MKQLKEYWNGMDIENKAGFISFLLFITLIALPLVLCLSKLLYTLLFSTWKF